LSLVSDLVFRPKRADGDFPGDYDNAVQGFSNPSQLAHFPPAEPDRGYQGLDDAALLPQTGSHEIVRTACRGRSSDAAAS
jgi:hypothetical protein